MDSTLGPSTSAYADDLGGIGWSVTVAHHPDAEQVGKRAPIAGEPVIVGRGAPLLGPGVLEDRRLSRRHAELCVDGDALTIRDLGSRNGTLLDGEAVGNEPAPVGEWGVIEVGKLLLVAHRCPPLYPIATDPDLMGVSPQHCAAVHALQQVADRSTRVVLVGETGTGKDLFARALHRASGRKGRFVVLDCGAIPSDRAVRELCGIDEGGESVPGIFEAAEGGTLYIDRVTDAPDELQRALLGFLERGEVRRLGASAPRFIDARVVASSMEPLDRLRDDLAARLGPVVIELSPLRDRRQDIPLLAHHFVRRYGGDELPVHRSFVAGLLAETWPGNVRELEAYVERAVIELSGDRLRAPKRLADSPAPGAPRLVMASDGSWFEADGSERVSLARRASMRRILAALGERAGAGDPRPLSIAELVGIGWPGEKVIESAGANRVYVALTTLRKLGLRELIERLDEGYRLVPDAVLRRL